MSSPATTDGRSLHLAGHAGGLELVTALGVLDDLEAALPGLPPGLSDMDRLRTVYLRLEPLAWRTKVRLDTDGDQADELRKDIRLHGWKRCMDADRELFDVALEIAALDPRGNLLKLRVAMERRTATAGVLVLFEPAEVDRWAGLLDGLYAPIFRDVPILLAAPADPA